MATIAEMRFTVPPSATESKVVFNELLYPDKLNRTGGKPIFQKYPRQNKKPEKRYVRRELIRYSLSGTYETADFADVAGSPFHALWDAYLEGIEVEFQLDYSINTDVSTYAGYTIPPFDSVDFTPVTTGRSTQTPEQFHITVLEERGYELRNGIAQLFDWTIELEEV